MATAVLLRWSTWPLCILWCRRWGTSPWWVRANHGHRSSFKIIDMTLVHSLVQEMVGNFTMVSLGQGSYISTYHSHGSCLSFKIIYMTPVYSLVQEMVGNLPWWVRDSHGNCLSFKIIYMTSVHSMVGRGPGILSACSGQGSCLSFFPQMLVKKKRRALARTNSDAHEDGGCTLVIVNQEILCIWIFLLFV